jgi:hypothetical protein
MLILCFEILLKMSSPIIQYRSENEKNTFLAGSFLGHWNLKCFDNQMFPKLNACRLWIASTACQN